MHFDVGSGSNFKKLFWHLWGKKRTELKLYTESELQTPEYLVQYTNICDNMNCKARMLTRLLVEMAAFFFWPHHSTTTTVISCMGIPSFSPWALSCSVWLINHSPAAGVTPRREMLTKFDEKTHFLLLSTFANYNCWPCSRLSYQLCGAVKSCGECQSTLFSMWHLVYSNLMETLPENMLIQGDKYSVTGCTCPVEKQ